MDFEEIKIREINVFLELLRTGSVRELARQRSCAPGQISKIITTLETKVGFKLLERSSFGVKPTKKAAEILPMFNEIRANQEAFLASFVKTKESPLLSFATTSFFSTQFVPSLFAQFVTTYPDYKLRLLDLPPDMFLNVAMRNGFQICLHLREMDWPKTWTSVKVGRVDWILCGRKGHPCQVEGKEASIKSIAKFPFVFPVYWSQNGIAYGNDNFPLSQNKRIRGYETSTATSAVEVIRHTDQLGFVPDIVARPLLESGALVKLTVSSLKQVSEPVFLSVKNDLVTQKMYSWLIRLCEERLVL